MSQLVVFLNRIASALIWPFTLLPAWLGLFLVSTIAGVVLLFIYGKVSNQAKIKAVKKKIYSSLLESILFRKDVRLCLWAQAKMFVAGGRYFSLAIFPVIILALPCIILLGALNIQYGSKALSVNKSAVVKVELDDAAALYDLSLSGPSGVEITPPVRVTENNQVFWRIDIKEPGNKDLELQLGKNSQAFKQTIKVGDSQQAVISNWRSTWYDKLLYPAAPAAFEKLKSVSVAYADQYYSLGVFEVHWLIFFLIFSMLSGIIASRFIGIEI